MHVSLWAKMFAFKVSDGYEQGGTLGGGGKSRMCD